MSKTQDDENVQVERPSWDSIWMQMANILSARSIDPRVKVGCLIVTDDNTQVLSVGYNGNEKGGSNEVASLEPGQSGCIHAEENALIKLDYNHPKRRIMFCTSAPCLGCAKRIINGNIAEVVYDRPYRETSGVELLVKAGVVVRRFSCCPS